MQQSRGASLHDSSQYLQRSEHFACVRSTAANRYWLPFFAHLKNIYVAYDHDKTGDEGSERVLKMFLDYGKIDAKLFRITLPEEVGEHGDITDYFVKLKKTPEELFSNFCEEYPERPEIDMSQFSTLYSEELIEILGLTIKKDETNKLITFLCELSAYTENSQVNISYIAPSSTGKSYIPMETATLFPKKDVIEVGYVSPPHFSMIRGNIILKRMSMLWTYLKKS